MGVWRGLLRDLAGLARADVMHRGGLGHTREDFRRHCSEPNRITVSSIERELR